MHAAVPSLLFGLECLFERCCFVDQGVLREIEKKLFFRKIQSTTTSSSRMMMTVGLIIYVYTVTCASEQAFGMLHVACCRHAWVCNVLVL
jgi:hypothetical protein